MRVYRVANRWTNVMYPTFHAKGYKGKVKYTRNERRQIAKTIPTYISTADPMVFLENTQQCNNFEMYFWGGSQSLWVVKTNAITMSWTAKRGWEVG